MNLELPDERVDAMRSQVLSTINDDVRRRGRRARKVLVGGVGALAVLTVLGVSLPAITTGSADYATSRQMQADGADGGVAMPEPDAMSADDRAAQAESADALANGTLSAKAAPEGYADQDIAPIPPPGEPLTAPGKDREVITTGSVTVEVKDTSEEADRFTAWVEKRGGRVDARSESRDEEDHTSAHIVARIPSKHVGAAVAELRKHGEVQSVDLQRDDVTAQGQDLDARIKALEISIDRLEAILERAATSNQVIEAESALSQRQQELESLQLQRRSLDDQVSLSSVSVSFVQESAPGSVAPGGFRGGLVAGWNALVDTVEAVVTAAGAAIPWLGVLALAGLAWWGVRRVRRHRG